MALGLLLFYLWFLDTCFFAHKSCIYSNCVSLTGTKLIAENITGQIQSDEVHFGNFIALLLMFQPHNDRNQR